MTKVVNFLKEEDGASAAEYALILAIIGAAIAGAMVFLGGAINTAVVSAGKCVTSGASC